MTDKFIFNYIALKEQQNPEFTNARYEYNGGTQNVQPNEHMIAFKE